MKSTLSQLLEETEETLPSRTRFFAAPNMWPAVGYGYTTPPSPYDKDYTKVSTTNLYLDLPSNLYGPAAKPRVTVARCKPSSNPYDADDMPRHLPAGLTQYVLHAFATKSPPYHVTMDDIATPPILIDVAKITGLHCLRGRGGAIAVLYETHIAYSSTWERELDLQAFHHPILSYWAAGPAQHQPHTRQYHQLRITAAAREIARSKGERHLPGSYRLVADNVYHARFRTAPLPIGASIWYHSFDGSRWLGKIKQPPDNSGRYVIRFLDNPGPALVELPESANNTALHAPCGSWCLQTHGRSNPLLGVLHGYPPPPLPRSLPRLFASSPPFCLLRFAQHGLLCLQQGSLCLRRGPLRLPPSPCSPPSSCLLRYAMSTPRMAIPTPKTAQDVFRFR